MVCRSTKAILLLLLLTVAVVFAADDAAARADFIASLNSAQSSWQASETEFSTGKTAAEFKKQYTFNQKFDTSAFKTSTNQATAQRNTTTSVNGKDITCILPVGKSGTFFVIPDRFINAVTAITNLHFENQLFYCYKRFFSSMWFSSH